MEGNKVTASAEPTMKQPLLNDAMSAVQFMYQSTWSDRTEDLIEMLLDTLSAPLPLVAFQHMAEHMLMEDIDNGETETILAFITPHIDDSTCQCYICQS